MKTLKLCQLITTSYNVLGKLEIGDEVIDTIETLDCLKTGTHEIVAIAGRYAVDGKDFLTMDKNGRYRNPGLVLGVGHAADAFDVSGKGIARQKLADFFGKDEKVKLIVTKVANPFAKAKTVAKPKDK